jgi:hypothetical protein
MTSDRNTARVAGTLFITATAASILSSPFLEPINASNYLVSVSANGNQVMVGAFFAIIGAAASASIAISLYPVVRRYSEGLALGAVGFRTVEGVFDIVGFIGLLLLITLSQQFVNAGAPDSSYFQTLGVLAVSGYHLVENVGKLLAFSIGCLLYYIIFYRTKLVPRWLSGWGLVAGILTMVSCLLTMFGLIAPFSTEQIVLNLPILPQELVLAVWLIVKGFNPSVIASKSPHVDS